MSLDVIEQEPQIALVGTKADVEDCAEDWDGTQQCVDRNVKDHARCNPAICAKAARTVDQMEADRCGDNVPDDRQQADDCVPAEANPREGDEVSAIEERRRPVEILQEPQILRVYWIVRAGDRVAHSDLLVAARLEMAGSIRVPFINGYPSVRIDWTLSSCKPRDSAACLCVLKDGSYIQAHS